MIRRLTQLHENERLVAAAQTLPGRLALWAVAAALLVWHGTHVLLLAALTLVVLDPTHKRAALSLAAVGLVAHLIAKHAAIDLGSLAALRSTTSPQWLLFTLGVLGALAVLCLLVLAVTRIERWPAIARRYAVLLVHAAIWGLLALSTVPAYAALAGVGVLAWRLSYLAKLGQRGKAAGTKLRDHLFYLVPVFGGGDTPHGKGLELLSRFEARNPEAFARTQLAGLKLLLLAILWIQVDAWMDRFFFGQTIDGMDPPGLADMLMVDLGFPWYHRWQLLYLDLVRNTLELAIAGHVVVGSLRLLGFNVFRNTYKPLLAESVVDFWSRYYFYFKELLVDFFFYPTYLRLRSTPLPLRLFAATFAAACLGNVYYHVLFEPEPVLYLDFQRAWAMWGPRFVYCALLAFGIWVSMLRQRQQRRASAPPSLPVRLRRIAGVLTFYAMIQIWNVRVEGVGNHERLEFFLSLFRP